MITSENREHMIIKELELYVEQFKNKFDDISIGFLVKEGKKQLVELGSNLLEGIAYYKELSDKFTKETKDSFLVSLESLTQEVLAMNKRVEVLS
ncbi:MAG: hypothetical protein DRP58_09170 [Spirochaetes bacterium]|nr:MAG: hypothetical protein DRP58_09170 [Spirochaetota bacterium]